jgi:hypothetical protein
MKTAEILDKAGGLYRAAKWRHSCVSLILFLLKAVTVAGLAAIGWNTVVPAVEKLGSNALITGMWAIGGFAVFLLIIYVFMSAAAKAYNILMVKKTLGLIKSGVMRELIIKLPGIFLISLIHMAIAAVMLVPFFLPYRNRWITISFGAANRGLSAVPLTLICAAVIAVIAVFALGVLFSFVPYIYLFRGKLFSAFWLSINLTAKSIRKTPMIWVMRLLFTFYAAAVFAVIVVIAGLFVKTPVVSMYQYVYTALYLLIKAAAALCVLSLASPLPVVYISAVYFAVNPAETVMLERVSERTGSRFGTALIDLAVPSVFVAALYLTARTVFADAAVGIWLIILVFVVSCGSYYAVCLLLMRKTLGRVLLK